MKGTEMMATKWAIWKSIQESDVWDKTLIERYCHHFSAVDLATEFIHLPFIYIKESTMCF